MRAHAPSPRPGSAPRAQLLWTRGLFASAWAWLPAFVVLALYLRTLQFTFVWDDLDLIVRNAVLQSGDWARLLAQDFWQSTGGGTGMWRPLVTFSYRVDGVLSGWQPWLFHLVNTLAHAASATLVVWLARARGAPRSWALGAGLCFATAPALSEAVAWVAGRTDAFATLATLAALALARRFGASGTWPALAGALACTVLALLSKESALVLPLLLAADHADQRALGAPGERRARAQWPALGALALVLAWALAHRALVAQPARPAEPGALAGVAALVWAHLAWLAPWAPHSPLLDLWTRPDFGLAGGAWAALFLVAVLVGWLVVKRVPHVLPLALLFTPLLPVASASLVESGVRFAERSLALPVAGMALAWSALPAVLPGRGRKLVLAALGVWVVAQAIVAWPAIGAWRDEESRLRRIAAVRPRDPDALLGLADLLSTQGRAEEARVWIAEASRVSTDSVGTLVARASLEYRAGRLDAARDAAERALAGSPHDLAAGVIRVRALAGLGRHAEAVAAGASLVAQHPGDPAAEGALGVAHAAAGDPAHALPLLARASARLLDDTGLAWDLGRAALATGDPALAREGFERVTRAEPGLLEGWLALADACHRLGDQPAAEAALARAEGLGGNDPRWDALRARIRGR